MAAELGHPGLEGVAGAQRLIVENHEQGLGAQLIIVISAHIVLQLEFFSYF